MYAYESVEIFGKMIYDYLFYRIYSFYKRKRDSTPVLMGCLVLMVLAFLTFLSLSKIFEIAFKIPKFRMGKYVIVIFLLSFLYLLFRRYKNTEVIKSLETKFQNEALNTRVLRGWLFIGYLILVLLIPIGIGFIQHNLGISI